MRLLLPFALVLSMSSMEIERAQQVARGRASEREQFHRRYVVNLPDPAVTQIEVITEFRRLVLTTEEHILRGDWLFSRSLRLAEEALRSSRGLVGLKASIRFNPLNAYVAPPAYVLAIGVTPGTTGSLAQVDTQLSAQYSTPFRGPGKKMVTSLVGAVIESSLPADRVGQTTRVVGVMLDGKEAARTIFDFARLD